MKKYVSNKICHEGMYLGQVFDKLRLTIERHVELVETYSIFIRLKQPPKRYKVLLTLGVINFITFNCCAQHKPIDTIEYRVVEQANANISNGAKINSNPSIADTTKPSRKVDYSTLGSQFPTTYIPESLKPVQLKGEPLDNLQHSLLNIGGGNYNTPYLEYFYNSVRSRDWDYGIHLNHFSSDYTTDNNNSAFSFNDVNLYATSFMANHTLTAQTDFDQHVVNDYGWNSAEWQPVALPNTRQRYDLFDGALQYTSHLKDSGKVNHDISMSYYNYSSIYGLSSNPENFYNTMENNVDINAHLFTYFQRQRIDIKAIAEYYNDDNLVESNHAWNLGINPYFSGNGRNWDARLGLKAYLDAVNGGTDIFPDLLARYHIADNAAIVYAGIDGDKQYNSYKSLSTVNPFIQDTINMKYTRTMYHLFFGFTGSFTNDFTYDINGSQSEVYDMPMFVTDTLEYLRNRFTVVYDDVQVTNFHADLAYQVKEYFRLVLTGDYFIYTPSSQVQVWYHPTQKVNLLGEYTIKQKCILKAEIFYVGSQYAPEIVDDRLIARQLAGYPDLNLGVDYKYNKFLTGFLHLNNLANTAYYQWDNYPTQQFNFLLGVRLTF
ncbi:MAG: hypothetical protein ACLQQ4_11110 [Bacteroidia bacterium]